MAGIPGRLQAFDQQREGVILMGESFQYGLAHLVEKDSERQISSQPGPQDDGIDEITGDTIEFTAATARAGRTHEDIVLARIAMQQYLEGGQEDHIKGSARGLRLFPEFPGQGFR